MTNEERREVARRLREIRPCKSGHIEWWGIAQALGLKEPAGWFGWEKFEPESVQRLADLIEPSEPKVRCVAEVKVDGERLEQLVYDAAVELTGVDRDALLALADNLDSSASMLLKQNDLDPNRKRRGMRRDHAQSLMAASGRIREACGNGGE